ncbi:hypothetical protein [Campylobacter hyointestinalis]|uniref:hypothetical protein n=1 Tax=Campylobacter hyointestinalis TaxID=198 RepID=UPI000DCDE545|nr:hypothetical protein [Campylobacter hyointestinalis]RAZ25510.1 hypothetical protein CHL9752_02770 [Campylobacter hyointestinalis subsp. lawsonii]RAZ39617.1 hypothetical protein CHL9426_02735 [Campylobacter hyointestinalis subsp. lawsonii]
MSIIIKNKTLRKIVGAIDQDYIAGSRLNEQKWAKWAYERMKTLVKYDCKKSKNKNIELEL